MALTEEQKQNYFLNIILFLSFVLVFFVLKPYISVLLLSFIMVVIFYPVYRYIVKKLRGHEVIGSIITTVLVILVVLIPISIFSMLVISQLNNAFSSGSQPLANISSAHLPGVLKNFNFDANGYAKNFLNNTTSDIGKVFSDITGVFIDLILTVISMIYLFKDGLRIKIALFNALPFTSEQEQKLALDMKTGIRAIIGGYFLIAILQGIISGIGFTVFGIPNPALWGFVAIIAALLPTFGTSLVNVPAAAFLFINHRTGAAIGLLIWWLAAISIIDNYIGPRFISGRVRIHILLLIFSIIGGLEFFGAIGFILGPLAIIFFWSILEMYQKKNIGTEKPAYALDKK